MTLVTSGNSKGISPKATPIRPQNSRSYTGTIYEGGKRLSRYFGYYSKIEPYLPDERIRKIKSQPVATSFDFARLFSKKKTNFISTKCRQFNQKYCN